MKKEDFVKLGISEELAEKAAEASQDELKGFIPKHRFDEVNDAKKKAEDDLKDRDKQLEELKKSAGSNEELKKQIETLQADNLKAKEEHDAKIKAMQIENAVERALTTAGAKNIKAVKALLDLGNAELDGDAVKGLDAQIKKLTESEDSKFLFNISAGGPGIKGAKPGEGGDDKNKGGIKNPWSKEHWNLTEQGKMLRENPELAAQLKNSK